jgi:hypothetical protein
MRISARTPTSLFLPLWVFSLSLSLSLSLFSNSKRAKSLKTCRKEKDREKLEDRYFYIARPEERSINLVGVVVVVAALRHLRDALSPFPRARYILVRKSADKTAHP